MAKHLYMLTYRHYDHDMGWDVEGVFVFLAGVGDMGVYGCYWRTEHTEMYFFIK